MAAHGAIKSHKTMHGAVRVDTEKFFSFSHHTRILVQHMQIHWGGGGHN